MGLIGISKVKLPVNRRAIETSYIGIFFEGIVGNDTPTSIFNTFTVEALELMGKFSQLAKLKGYIVAMAPAGK